MLKKHQIDYADIMMITLACIMSLPAMGLVFAAVTTVPAVEGILASML